MTAMPSGELGLRRMLQILGFPATLCWRRSDVTAVTGNPRTTPHAGRDSGEAGAQP